MQRYEVEAIFEQKKDGLFEDINISSQKPIAIILGGQPACGKSTLINVAKKDHPNLDFLTVNGDLYRQFHPNKELIKDPIKYPIETQIFSSVFTEKLIEEAIKRKCNIIIEGTMRNPDVPLKTAQKFKDAGFRVEAYIIAAPKEFTQLGLYNRYQEEVLSKGQGRLADIDSHNKAVNGLMKSANQLYSDKAVDKISIHTYLAKERIKDFNLVNGEWSCKSMPSIFIDESRAKQMKNKEILKTFKQEVFTCKKLLMTKKKLPVRFTGQHFTIDKVLIKDAIRQANISNQDTVLDIGAGKGFLTVHLLKIANNVVAIENDTALVEHLRKLFSDARNVQVVGCDFRNFAVPKFPFKVVSNIPYGITSDIFKILMFESLGNFLGGSIVLQLEPTQKLFSRKLYNPYTVFYHTFFDLKLVYEVGPESFLPPPTVKSALLNIKRKHLFFDFKFKAKYLAFISCLLEKPDLSVKTALKSIFRKSQVRSISEKFGLNLNAQIVCLSPSQWLNCFLEMLEVVPEKFHPS